MLRSTDAYTVCSAASLLLELLGPAPHFRPKSDARCTGLTPLARADPTIIDPHRMHMFLVPGLPHSCLITPSARSLIASLISLFRCFS
jgi:hypothetical protein